MGEFLMWFGIVFVVVFIYYQMTDRRYRTRVVLSCPSCGNTYNYDLAMGSDFNCPRCGLPVTVVY